MAEKGISTTLVFGFGQVYGQILDLQHKHTVAYRKIYNNISKVNDKDFKKQVIEKHVFSTKAYEYLVKEVLTAQEIEMGQKDEMKVKLQEAKDGLKGERRADKRRSLQRRIASLTRSIKAKPVFGTRKLLRELTTQGVSNKISKKEYRLGRVMMPIFYGEAARKGNRFFDFRGLSEGNIVFKYEATDVRIPLHFVIKNKKHRETLKKLEELLLQGKTTLTVRLAANKIMLTYNTAAVEGNLFDKKSVYEEISNITDEVERRKILAQRHREHDALLLDSKNPNIFAGVDINPAEIGVSILLRKSEDPQGDFEVLAKKCFKFDDLISNETSADKHKYELSIIMKDIFRWLRYWNAGTLVMEDISLTNEDHGHRELNRQVNNKWRRELVTSLAQRRCVESGIKFLEVNPTYSSFIGNILYKTYDPVAASIEVGRRGLVKYFKKSSLLPTFIESIMTESGLVLTKMDYDDLVRAKSWKGLKGTFDRRRRSVRRREINDFTFTVKDMNGTRKSGTQIFSLL